MYVSFVFDFSDNVMRHYHMVVSSCCIYLWFIMCIVSYLLDILFPFNYITTNIYVKSLSLSLGPDESCGGLVYLSSRASLLLHLVFVHYSIYSYVSQI